MADFGQNTRPLSPVDFKHNDSRTTSLFFPTSLIDDQNGNKPENKNGVCEDCIEDSTKSKVNSTQAQTANLGQKKIGFSGENSMFHDFPTSTTFWSPANLDDGFVQTGIPPVNGVHYSANTQIMGSPRRPLTAQPITTTISQQARRSLQNSSQYIAGQGKANINSLASGWNGNQAVTGWPQQQPSTTWGRNYSSQNNTILNRSSSRPSSLSFPQSSRYRANGGSTRPSYNSNSRHGISAQTITQGLQSLNLNGQHPIDGTILDNITGLGNSHGTNNELSNSFYSYQVSRM